jgi:hypothetical protein
MDNEKAYYYLFDLESSYVEEIISEWKCNKGNVNARQAWRVIPAGMLIKEYCYSAKTSLTHDNIIEKFQDIVIENYLKLSINTILFGHSSANPFSNYEIYFPEDFTSENFDELFEGFEWFAIDEKGNWRISDYGLDKIGRYVIALLEEEDYNKKLVWIDCILNVAHQRSDLASWFVEGGRKTLSFLNLN